jgi:hypothetical protein
VLVNATARHVLPVALNAMSNALAADGTSITVTSAPLPPTMGAINAVTQFQNMTSVLFMVIAFAFVPGSIIAFVVKEREMSRNSKHQQLISGVSVPGYWLATLLWDMTVYMLPLVLAVILLYIFDLDPFKGSVCDDWTPGASMFNPFAVLFNGSPAAIYKNGAAQEMASCAQAAEVYGCGTTLDEVAECSEDPSGFLATINEQLTCSVAARAFPCETPIAVLLQLAAASGVAVDAAELPAGVTTMADICSVPSGLGRIAALHACLKRSRVTHAHAPRQASE